MCGIFGIIDTQKKVELADVKQLAEAAQRRGMDSSGIIYASVQGEYKGHRADYKIDRLLSELLIPESTFIMGHSRLITNGLEDNQPVLRNGVCVIHNGIVVNDAHIWKKLKSERKQQIDTEIIAAIVEEFLNDGRTVLDAVEYIKNNCIGTISCVILVPSIGEAALFTNNGSLYVGEKNGAMCFYSEEYALRDIECSNIRQVKEVESFSIPCIKNHLSFEDRKNRINNIIPGLGQSEEEEKSLQYFRHNLKRCTKCILPATMPFILFDEKGECNYCKAYEPKQKVKSKEKFLQIIDGYRKNDFVPCIVPFSGGRDSSYALHVIVNELKIKPITMTYDWGMVTDLARRNVSRMCGSLGVENIIIADNIEKKREYIAKNLKAWLKRPHLGMLNILMAGDKHFFRHMESIKNETNFELNLWGMNPLEVTHFKAGFLGFPPDFQHDQVFYTGLSKQLHYQYLRFLEMIKNPSYLNSSLWDTLSGEYYRSVKKKTGFHNIFDYWEWDEEVINATLDTYDWERSPDTPSTWRIGDGTAAFYNYVYYTVAGFSEFDTFRSNQIREGTMSREDALSLVDVENKPRYPNIKWYLDAIGMPFKDVIKVINEIPKLYEAC